MHPSTSIVDDAHSRVDGWHLATHLGLELSGGERQRVSITMGIDRRGAEPVTGVL